VGQPNRGSFLGIPACNQNARSEQGINQSGLPAIGRRVGSRHLPQGQGVAVARGFRLQWEEAQNAHVLLYPEGMIKLNGSAGEILKRCDGAATVADITADLERAFATANLSGDVIRFVTMAVEKKWLQIL